VHELYTRSLGGRKGIRPVINLGGCGGGGAVSSVGVAPTRTVRTSAYIIFPCSIKIQKTGGEETQPERSTALCYCKAEGRVFLLVPAYPGCPGTKAIKRLLLLLLSYISCPAYKPTPIPTDDNTAKSSDLHMSKSANWR